MVSDHILAFFLAMLAVHVVDTHFPRMKNDLKPLVYLKKKKKRALWEMVILGHGYVVLKIRDKD